MPLFTSPFPKLAMPPAEKQQLVATATELLEKAQTRFERYLGEEKSKIDTSRWSLVREREQVRVYHDRRQRVGADTNDLHAFLTVGSLVGTLDDAMYGELNHTTDAMRVKTAYVKDTLVDSAVLETIQEPTLADPFQSMTLRWFAIEVPLHVRLLARHHDDVYLEATGVRQLSTGERFGFRLMHSIATPRAPKLPQFDRDSLSVCTLWRQLDLQRVQVYSTAYIALNEMAFVVPMAVKSLGNTLSSLHRMVECAQLKKLASLVHSKGALLLLQREQTGSHDQGCAVCGSQSRSARKGIKSCCAICAKTTCGACRQKKKIFMISPDRQLLALKMRFCLPCIASASLLDAAAVARDELNSAGNLSTSSGSFLMPQSLSRTESSSSSSSSDVISSNSNETSISSTSS